MRTAWASRPAPGEPQGLPYVTDLPGGQGYEELPSETHEVEVGLLGVQDTGPPQGQGLPNELELLVRGAGLPETETTLSSTTSSGRDTDTHPGAPRGGAKIWCS